MEPVVMKPVDKARFCVGTPTGPNGAAWCVPAATRLAAEERDGRRVIGTRLGRRARACPSKARSMGMQCPG